MEEYVHMSKEMLAAKRQGDLDATCLLLERGEYPDAEDESRNLLLLWAARRGFTRVVRLLLDKGANINPRGEEGETPLLQASYEGHIDVVRLLVEGGADLNLATLGGWTPLIWARVKKHEEIVKILLSAGALEDISETLEEKQRERSRQESHTRNLEMARSELSLRAENRDATKAWVGAWASPLGPGTAVYVFHADGTVMSCGLSGARKVAHLDDPGDGTLFYRLLNGKTTKIEAWSVSEDGLELRMDYGSPNPTISLLRL